MPFFPKGRFLVDLSRIIINSYVTTHTQLKILATPVHKAVTSNVLCVCVDILIIIQIMMQLSAMRNLLTTKMHLSESRRVITLSACFRHQAYERRRKSDPNVDLEESPRSLPWVHHRHWSIYFFAS